MRLFSLICLLGLSITNFAQDCKSFKSSWPLKRLQDPNINFNSRSDTFDIENYDITLDLTNTTDKYLEGICTISLTPLIDANTLTLDLKALVVDSIIWNSSTINFVQSGEFVKVNISGLWTVGNPETITVYYHGNPVEDPSGFGGFYFESGYAYNLGVAFSDNPHNYGRTWHPCFDNFVERASYRFEVKTAGGYKAHCNGALTDETSLGGDTLIRTWVLEESIPTYLACVAAANYATVHQSIGGMNGIIPVELVAKAGDTTNLKNSFVNLESTFHAFEEAFGPYLWNKVGYNMTTVGAMEHPTAISYPISIVNGATTYENIMAHELAHHWWGNLITCETAEDMWINEGFAEYCSHLFLETVYNKQTYINAVEDNHFNVLQTAHLEEGSYLPVSGIPHENTYGKHVYNKGASVAHNLRTYMGDDEFFPAMKALMDSFAFQSINSEQMRSFLMDHSTAPIFSFFEDWVFNPGFPHFEVDSFIKTPNHPTQWEVSIEQKTLGAPEMFAAVPLAVTFSNKAGDVQTDTISTPGSIFTYYFDVDFDVDWVVLNANNEICMAILENQRTIDAPGSYSFSDASLNLSVSAVGGDSAVVRIEQHLVAPDPIKNNTGNYRLSTSRYWTMEGFIEPGFDASTTIFYDSRGEFPLDGNLAAVTEDSILLMYRADAYDDWKEYWYYSKNTMGSTTNGVGRMSVTKFIPGQYTFANGVSTIGMIELQKPEVSVFPNPSSKYINVSHLPLGETVRLFDTQGKLLIEKKADNAQLAIDVSPYPNGTYILQGTNWKQQIEVIK